MDDDGSQATRGDSSVPDGTANREGFNIATVEREVAKLSSLQEKQAYILSKIADLHTDLNLVRELNNEDTRQQRANGGRLLLVSHRLPFRLHQLGGGWRAEAVDQNMLEEGLQSLSLLHNDRSCVWIGWPGCEVESTDQNAVREQLYQSHNYYPIFIEERKEALFYQGYCKKILWPLFHSNTPVFTDQVELHEEEETEDRMWQAYVSVNQSFADSIQDLYQEGDVIWIQDYHLMLLPQLLRNLLPNESLTIGFFLHIPFPSSEYYRVLPQREDVLEGVLAADLIGFQTYDYVRHFQSAAARILGAKSSHKSVELNGQYSTLTVCPVAIDYELFRNLARASTVETLAEVVERKFRSRKVLLGVDRMDLNKGLMHKLLGIEELLNNKPELAEVVIFLQVAIPSDQMTREEELLSNQCHLLVSRINSRFQDIGGDAPVQLITRELQTEHLVSLYTLADVFVVTPTREGMNTLPFQYIVCRDAVDRLATVVLSEFAGCSESLGGAIILNPWDSDELADKLYESIMMDEYEREIKHAHMRQYILGLTSRPWGDNFLEQLEEAKQDNYPSTSRELYSRDLVTTYARSRRRLLVLNYEDVLVHLSSIPELSLPPEEVYDYLQEITADSKNTLVVVSGRSGKVMEKWFGDLPLILAAEHGAYIRWEAGESWEGQLEDPDSEVWDDVELILTYYTERTPGAYVERKDSAITWHYRDCDEEHGLWQMRELQFGLHELTKRLPLNVICGDKYLEIRPKAVSKAKLLEKVLERLDASCLEDNTKDTTAEFPSYGRIDKNTALSIDFLLVVASGEDYTDEEMFSVLVPPPFDIDEYIRDTQTGVPEEKVSWQSTKDPQLLGRETLSSESPHRPTLASPKSVTNSEQRKGPQTIDLRKGPSQEDFEERTKKFVPRKDFPPTAALFEAMKKKYGTEFQAHQLPESATAAWALVNSPVGNASATLSGADEQVEPLPPGRSIDERSLQVGQWKLPLNTFICTIGRKLSQAPYYVRRQRDFINLLRMMANSSEDATTAATGGKLS